jgi:transmembrane sensor
MSQHEGELSLAEREAFIGWLKTSPEHVRAYLQVSAHWEDARALNKASVPSVAELVAMAREPTSAKVIPIGEGPSREGSEEVTPPERLAHATPRARARILRLRRFLIAASIAVAAVGFVSLYWLEYQRGVYSTLVGEQRSITLEDGSTVELNARSTIRVAYHAHERDVDLIEGQVLFQVAKDHSRPFIVHSANTHVLAVGTQFDVYQHQTGTTVTVVEGRVAVFPLTSSAPGQAVDLPAVEAEILREKVPEVPLRAGRAKSETPGEGPLVPSTPMTAGTGTASNEIFLAAGEQVTVSSASVERTEHADVAAATAWTQKHIVFNSTPLSEVVDEFNRYNTRQMVITDPTIAETKISGEFSSTNPDSLLKGLDALKKFNIHATSDRIEISAK